MAVCSFFFLSSMILSFQKYQNVNSVLKKFVYDTLEIVTKINHESLKSGFTNYLERVCTGCPTKYQFLIYNIMWDGPVHLTLCGIFLSKRVNEKEFPRLLTSMCIYLFVFWSFTQGIGHFTNWHSTQQSKNKGQFKKSFTNLRFTK